MGQKLIDSFTYILREAVTDSMSIESVEHAVMEENDEDPEWSGGEDDTENGASSSKLGTFRFGDVDITDAMVTKAISFYRSSEKGSSSLSCMKNKFRFIKDKNHMEKLRKIEREREVIADRRIKLRMLAEKLREVVRLKFSAELSLHDRDSKIMALQINATELHISNFCASHNWIQKFKRSSGIVSRRITTFTSKRNFLDSERLAQVAQEFVSAVKIEMPQWPLAAVCNADQSGFVKEMHSARSLAQKGVRKVGRVVQSVSATTYSFTFMSTIFVDGHLGEKLFVVLQERQGVFPSKGHLQAGNLGVRTNTTHMMNKVLFIKWVRTCLATPSSPTSTLLLVDLWTAFKDHSTIESVVPSGKHVKIMIIPAGTTSQIQPLDVLFFLPFKAMWRFSSYVQAHEIDFPVHHRDCLLKFLSLIYARLFCASRFRGFLSYPGTQLAILKVIRSLPNASTILFLFCNNDKL